MYTEFVGVPRGYTSEAPWPQAQRMTSLPLQPLYHQHATSGPPHLGNVGMFTDMKLWGHLLYLSKNQAITSTSNLILRERYPNQLYDRTGASCV